MFPAEIALRAAKRLVRARKRIALGWARVLPILFIVAFWELATKAEIINPSVLPSFSSIAAAFIDLLSSGNLLSHLLISLYRSFAGLVLGIIIGTAIGIKMGLSRRFEEFFDPIITATYPLPKSTLIPLAILWLGIGDLSKIVVIFIGCMTPMVINSYHGAKGVENVLIWSARSLGTSEKKLLRRIILPAAMPQIFNGVRIALAFSFIIVIAAELVASKVGIGNLILQFGEGGIYDYMFAAILAVVIVAFAMDRGYVALATRLLRWYEEQ